MILHGVTGARNYVIVIIIVVVMVIASYCIHH